MVVKPGYDGTLCHVRVGKNITQAVDRQCIHMLVYKQMCTIARTVGCYKQQAILQSECTQIVLVKKCTKPDRKEFQKIAMATATAIGFAIMGFIGFFVKLIHIPINNIIVGS